MDTKEDLDARARAIADAARKVAPAVVAIAAVAIVEALLVVLVIPNVMLLVREYRILH